MAVNKDMVYRHVGSRVRDRRVTLGLSQADLAGKVGLLRTSITNLEKGQQKVPLHVLYALAEVLNTNVGALLPTQEEATQSELVVVRVGDAERPTTPLTAGALSRALEFLEDDDGHKD